MMIVFMIKTEFGQVWKLDAFYSHKGVVIIYGREEAMEFHKLFVLKMCTSSTIKDGRFRMVPVPTPIPIPQWHSDSDSDSDSTLK